MNSKKTNSNPKIIAVIPVMNEKEYIQSLLNSIKSQTYNNFYIIACVNQPESWWQNDEKKEICQNNIKTLDLLKRYNHFSIEVIDRCSKGLGFIKNEKGVGHARNLLFDRALDIANDSDIIMSLDADITFKPSYFQSVADIFLSNPDSVAHSNPYYHKLTGGEQTDRAILRYEIYMRLYALNLWRIKSPYAFTPLGSVISVRAKSLRSIGKLTPKSAGEDFYLLQKLRKHGRITQYNELFVYPAARTSNRVPFGTGPAITEFLNKNYSRYPIYPTEPFDLIHETYKLLPILFSKDISTPMDDFFYKTFNKKNIFSELRSNFKEKDKFIRACHTKIDGLRIFQYVKYYQEKFNNNNEENILKHLNIFFGDNEINSELKNKLKSLNIEKISLPLLNELRDLLFIKELEYQKNDFHEPQLPF